MVRFLWMVESRNLTTISEHLSWQLLLYCYTIVFGLGRRTSRHHQCLQRRDLWRQDHGPHHGTLFRLLSRTGRRAARMGAV